MHNFQSLALAASAVSFSTPSMGHDLTVTGDAIVLDGDGYIKGSNVSYCELGVLEDDACVPV